MRLVPMWDLWFYAWHKVVNGLVSPGAFTYSTQLQSDEEGCGAVVCAARLVPD